MHVYVEKRRLDCGENHPTFNLSSVTLPSLRLTHSTPLLPYWTLQTCFHPEPFVLAVPFDGSVFPGNDVAGSLTCQILTQLLPSQCILTRPITCISGAPALYCFLHCTYHDGT